MIKAVNINKSYAIGTQVLPVLNDISLVINKGEFVSLMGPSGSGKSTLLYILGGLDKADSGSVFINGNKIGNQSDATESAMRRDDIGFIFQSYNLIENLTVAENILIPALLAGKKRKDINTHLKKLLHAVGLYEYRDHHPIELSGGQQQRTAIARALINEPKIIFADEPIGNLDSENGRGILELLCRLNQQYTITILMVTHSEDATKYGSRTIRLKDGHLV